MHLVVAGHHVAQTQVRLCDVISRSQEMSGVRAELDVSFSVHVPELLEDLLDLQTRTKQDEERTLSVRATPSPVV